MSPADFDHALAQQGKSFDMLSGLDSPSCRLRFTGSFEGEPVIWDASLMSLAYYLSEMVARGQPQPAARQFIEVGDMTADGRQITIALQLPLIDEPTIIKTMIMVRQYKRLASGRHEYGAAHSL